MKEVNVTLNTKEQRRLMILNQLGLGSLASQEGAGLLGISERQLRRLRRAYEERGAAALAHGNRGRSPVNVVTASVRQRVVMLATTRYHGVSHPATATEPCSRRPSARAARRRAVRPGPRMDPRQAAAAPREQSRHHPRPTRWDCAE